MREISGELTTLLPRTPYRQDRGELDIFRGKRIFHEKRRAYQNRGITCGMSTSTSRA